jgi:cytochrome P450 family 6
LGARVFPREVEDYFVGVLKDTIQYRQDNNTQRNDFLNLLIQLMEKGNIDEEVGGTDTRKITFNELAAQAFLFLFAGFETTSTTMGFMFYEMAFNQDIQQEARKEVESIVKKYDGEITYEAIQDMNYLQRVMNETLRKYPPAGVVFRIAGEDYKVKNTNHVIEKGTTVFIPVYAVHHDPEIYENPSKFDPDRFLPEEVAKRHNLSFLAFGAGNRNCIGI